MAVSLLRAVPKPEPKAKKPRGHMKRRRSRRIDRKTPAEAHYTAWIHGRPCVGRGTIPFHICEGPIQQAHIRDMTGLGLKASDFLSVAACRDLHESYDQAKGIFESYGKEGRKHWLYSRIIEAHADFHLEHGFPPEDWQLPKGMKL